MKTDPVTKKLFGYLVKLDLVLAKSIFGERTEAETMFDKALSRM